MGNCVANSYLVNNEVLEGEGEEQLNKRLKQIQDNDKLLKDLLTFKRTHTLTFKKDNTQIEIDYRYYKLFKEFDVSEDVEDTQFNGIVGMFVNSYIDAYVRIEGYTSSNTNIDIGDFVTNYITKWIEKKKKQNTLYQFYVTDIVSQNEVDKKAFKDIYTPVGLIINVISYIRFYKINLNISDDYDYNQVSELELLVFDYLTNTIDTVLDTLIYLNKNNQFNSILYDIIKLIVDKDEVVLKYEVYERGVYMYFSNYLLKYAAATKSIKYPPLAKVLVNVMIIERRAYSQALNRLSFVPLGHLDNVDNLLYAINFEKAGIELYYVPFKDFTSLSQLGYDNLNSHYNFTKLNDWRISINSIDGLKRLNKMIIIKQNENKNEYPDEEQFKIVKENDSVIIPPFITSLTLTIGNDLTDRKIINPLVDNNIWTHIKSLRIDTDKSSNLNGIELYDNITSLKMYGPIEISKLPVNLEELEFNARKSKITIYPVSLQYLRISNAKGCKGFDFKTLINLKRFSVYNCEELETLIVPSIEKIDISRCVKLKNIDLPEGIHSLTCNYNSILNLNCPASLIYLEFLYNDINVKATVNVSKCTQLVRFDCRSPLKELNLGNCTRLEDLNLTDCGLKGDLDVSLFKELSIIYINRESKLRIIKRDDQEVRKVNGEYIIISDDEE
jgi:hypothetical protein